MIEAQAVAQGANPSQAKKRPTRKPKSARAQAYKSGRKTWSARVRRQGADIFLSGYTSQGELEQELNERLAALSQRGKPHGEGAERTSVAQALSEHALKHLPSLKGAEQEARRINKYLRAARLPALQVRRLNDEAHRQGLPKGAQLGAYCAVWLLPPTANRSFPKVSRRTASSCSRARAARTVPAADSVGRRGRLPSSPGESLTMRTADTMP